MRQGSRTTITFPIPILPLFALLVALKLTGIVDWSWWIITAPMWMPLALALAILLLVGAGLFVLWVLMWMLG